jgi:hypothetical protein
LQLAWQSAAGRRDSHRQCLRPSCRTSAKEIT